MERIDLHTHSTFSDGTFTPTQIIQYAKEKNIKAIALTDHDTVEGLNEASKKAKELEIEFINGIELAASYKEMEIHILGLFIDRGSRILINELKDNYELRKNRNLLMLDKLNSAGINIEYEDLLYYNKKNIITRAHFARAICDTISVNTFP